MPNSLNFLALTNTLDSSDPTARLVTLRLDWVYRREYRSVRDNLDAVAALKIDDLTAVLAKYPLTRNTTLTIGPLAEVPDPK